MRFMHQGGTKSFIGLLLVSTALLCSTFIHKKEDSNAPSGDIQALDAKLLADLRHQKIEADPASTCVMECGHISIDQLKMFFDIDLVNYDKCDEGNCHFTSYTIEGKTDDGKSLQFKLDTGEDGNLIHALTIDGVNCACDQL